MTTIDRDEQALVGTASARSSRAIGNWTWLIICQVPVQSAPRRWSGATECRPRTAGLPIVRDTDAATMAVKRPGRNRRAPAPGNRVGGLEGIEEGPMTVSARRLRPIATPRTTAIDIRRVATRVMGEGDHRVVPEAGSVDDGLGDGGDEGGRPRGQPANASRTMAMVHHGTRAGTAAG